MIKRVLFAMAAMLSFTTPAHAGPQFPNRGTAVVVDEAHLFSTQEKLALSKRLTAWERRTGHQMVVVTVPNLQGYDIKTYGYQLGRYWQLGQLGGDDGILIIRAVAEKRTRIEVGTRLEPVLTDAYTGDLLRRTVVPLIKTKGAETGLSFAADTLMSYVEVHEIAEDELPTAMATPQPITTPAMALASTSTTAEAVRSAVKSDDPSDASDWIWIVGLLGVVGVAVWFMFAPRPRPPKPQRGKPESDKGVYDHQNNNPFLKSPTMSESYQAPLNNPHQLSETFPSNYTNREVADPSLRMLNETREIRRKPEPRKNLPRSEENTPPYYGRKPTPLPSSPKSDNASFSRIGGRKVEEDDTTDDLASAAIGFGLGSVLSSSGDSDDYTRRDSDIGFSSNNDSDNSFTGGGSDVGDDDV